MFGRAGLWCVAWGVLMASAVGAEPAIEIKSRDGRNALALLAGERLEFSVSRDGRLLIGPSPLGPVLARGGDLDENSRVVGSGQGDIDDEFPLHWGKTARVDAKCNTGEVTLETAKGFKWMIELRAYDARGAFSSQEWSVNLSGGNAPPAIVWITALHGFDQFRFPAMFSCMIFNPVS